MVHKTLTKAHLSASYHLVLFQAPLTGPLSAPNDTLTATVALGLAAAAGLTRRKTLKPAVKSE